MHTADAQSFVNNNATLDRAKMFRSAKGHTRLVKFLRVGLPSISLVLIGLYFIPNKLELKVILPDLDYWTLIVFIHCLISLSRKKLTKRFPN